MANYERRRRVHRHGHPSPQHLFCPQPQQLGPHSGGPASKIWCKRCGRAGHEAKTCAAREPRRFNGICGIGYDSPIFPPSYSGRTDGTGCDIPWSPPQYNGSHSYRAKPFARRHSGGDGTSLSPQQQPAPRHFSSFGWEQRYNGGHSTALPPQQPAPRPFSRFGWEQRYNDGHSTELWPQQQPLSCKGQNIIDRIVMTPMRHQNARMERKDEQARLEKLAMRVEEHRFCAREFQSSKKAS